MVRKKRNKIILIDSANMVKRMGAMDGVARWAPQSLIFNHLCWIFERLEPTKVMAAWEGRSSRDLRKKLFEGYKSNRDKLKKKEKKVRGNTKKQAHLGPWTKQHLMFPLPIHILENDELEADDIIAITVNKIISEQDDFDDIIIIISSDQDFYQLVSNNVVIYNPITKAFITEKILREKFGVFNLQNLAWIKAITGDVSDSIPGLSRVGLPTAKKLLHSILNSESVWTWEDVKPLIESKKNIEVVKTYHEIVQLQHCLSPRGQRMIEKKLDFALANPSKYDEKKLIEVYAKSGIYKDINKDKLQRKLLVLSEFAFSNRRT